MNKYDLNKYIKNIETKRMIKIGGVTHLRLIKDGKMKPILDEEIEIVEVEKQIDPEDDVDVDEYLEGVQEIPKELLPFLKDDIDKKAFLDIINNL